MNYHSMHMNRRDREEKKANEKKNREIFWNKRVINHKIIFLKMIIQRRKGSSHLYTLLRASHSFSIIYQFLNARFFSPSRGFMLRSQKLLFCSSRKNWKCWKKDLKAIFLIRVNCPMLQHIPSIARFRFYINF
jgi:hypothetical protein